MCGLLYCRLPFAGCDRTVYLLDDGKDRTKRKWCTKLGPDVVYVSGRKRPADESNGKSGNLNNALSQIYPDSCKIPGNEVVCIMDADQVGSTSCNCCPAGCMQPPTNSCACFYGPATVIRPVHSSQVGQQLVPHALQRTAFTVLWVICCRWPTPSSS